MLGLQGRWVAVTKNSTNWLCSSNRSISVSFSFNKCSLIKKIGKFCAIFNFFFNIIRWSRVNVAICGTDFMPEYRLDPNAAYLNIMTNYSNNEKSTKLHQWGFREDTVRKSSINR